MAKAAVRMAQDEIQRLYREFASLPPGTRELVAKHYVEAMFSAFREEEQARPKTRYEMLMSDDDSV